MQYLSILFLATLSITLASTADLGKDCHWFNWCKGDLSCHMHRCYDTLGWELSKNDVKYTPDGEVCDWLFLHFCPEGFSCQEHVCVKSTKSGFFASKIEEPEQPSKTQNAFLKQPNVDTPASVPVPVPVPTPTLTQTLTQTPTSTPTPTPTPIVATKVEEGQAPIVAAKVEEGQAPIADAKVEEKQAPIPSALIQKRHFKKQESEEQQQQEQQEEEEQQQEQQEEEEQQQEQQEEEEQQQEQQEEEQEEEQSEIQLDNDEIKA